MTSSTQIAVFRHVLPPLKKSIGWIDRVNARISPHAVEGEEIPSPDRLSRRAVLWGVWMFAAVFGILGLWSALAPIESSALAVGQVVLDSNRKTIQHLEGGIVANIFVREGDKVTKGAPLIQLEETTAKSKLDSLTSQRIALKTMEARLLAERDHKEAVAFPKDIRAMREENSVAAENIDSQRRMFSSRKKNVEGQVSILKQKIAQYKEEINGLTSQKESATKQIALLEEEIASVRKLLKQGNAQKPRLLALERQQAALKGQRGENISGISRAKQSIAESKIAIMNTKNDFLKDVMKDLNQTQVQLADLEERIRAAADTMDRIVIAAPLTGKVTGLKVHTIGGVITPGAPVMDIVPQDDKLIIEAKVRTQDIDVVHPGLVARVRLTAYRSRYVPMLQGKVLDVSADSFQNERTGEAYFNARIEIDGGELEALGEDVKLYPGMPAEIHIVTGARTFLAYMFDPINHSFSNAFREE